MQCHHSGSDFKLLLTVSVHGREIGTYHRRLRNQQVFSANRYRKGTFPQPHFVLQNDNKYYIQGLCSLHIGWKGRYCQHVTCRVAHRKPVVTDPEKLNLGSTAVYYYGHSRCSRVISRYHANLALLRFVSWCALAGEKMGEK